VSYWMQFLLALLAFVLLELYTFWTYYICITIFSCSHGRVKAKIKAKKIQDGLKHHAIPLLSALVEFQKAQCFFAIAVEIAAQILALASSLGVSNLGQLFTNYEFIPITAIHGSIPITFTLLCLRRAGIRSWYLSTLSAYAVALSAATYGSVNKFEGKCTWTPMGLGCPLQLTPASTHVVVSTHPPGVTIVRTIVWVTYLPLQWDLLSLRLLYSD